MDRAHGILTRNGWRPNRPLGNTENDRLQLIIEVASIADSGAQPPQLFRDCARSIVRHLHLAAARVCLMDEAGQLVDLGADVQAAGLAEAAPPSFDDEDLRRLRRDRAPRVWVDYGPGWVASVPVVASGRIVGVLAIRSEELPSDLDLQALTVVANIVAPEMQRARAGGRSAEE